MGGRKPSAQSLLIITASLLGFAGLATLVATDRLGSSDGRFLSPPLDPSSALGQIATAVALVTHPLMVGLGLLVVAIWCYRRRLRNLAVALLLAVTLATGGQLAWQLILPRPRPLTAITALSTIGSSFPASHLTAASVAAVMVTATVVVTRQTRRLALRWLLLAGLGVVVAGVNTWLLGANWLSDILAGICWGVCCASTALVLASVQVIPLDQPRRLPDGPLAAKRCAVIWNPTKVTDEATFRRHVEYELRERGWKRAIWLSTTPDDPGVAMTATARAKQVDLVLAAGGDGTIRTVCAGLADSGIPLGVIPAGTGNLLARNVGIPLDERAALEVAFAGHEDAIDLIEVTADHDPSTTDHFIVMAGIGVDAAIIAQTNPELKKAVGSAAYFLSAAQNARHEPVNATFSVDGGAPFTRLASVILIGNVGFLQGGIPLIPDARPNDGLFDLMVVSPSNVGDWLHVFTRVLTRQRRTDERLDRRTGQRVEITVARSEGYELDGDATGHCRHLAAQVRPRAVRIRLPH